MPETIDAPVTTQVSIIEPQQSAMLTPAERALAQAEALVIDSPEMNDIAGFELKAIKNRYNALEAQRKALVKPLDEHRARLMDLFRKPLSLLEQAEAAIKRSMLVYSNKVDEERRREEARLAEQARREQAEKEAQAKAAQAKADAEAAELRRKAEEAAAAGRAGEAAKLTAKAEAKVEAGETKAEELRQAAANMPTAVVLPPPPKVAGVHTTVTYDAECDNLLELARFVVANPIFLNCIQVNQPALRQQAKSMKEAFAIGGCRLVKKAGISARAA